MTGPEAWRLERALPTGADVVVVGAGMIGCAAAARLAEAGAEVLVVDRLGPCAGSSSAGEGNLLLSDKLPGADLAIARRSLALWRELAAEVGDRIEYEQKGGVVVADTSASFDQLCHLAEAQRERGVEAVVLAGAELRAAEPGLHPGLVGGVLYPEDAQVQPMLAVQAHLERFRSRGGTFSVGVEVTGAELDPDRRIRRLETSAGSLVVGTCVVNAAGAWAGALAERIGAFVPVVPRRGHVLVTEPVVPLTARKVYEAGYVADIHGDDENSSVSAVVEGTRPGTMLLGSSREFAGFSRELDLGIVAAIARRAVALFPGLAGIRLMRTYLGFRPATPDRLPVIGPDAEIGGLLHATGHEGAGIGLSQATAEAVCHLVAGTPIGFDPAPFSPARFTSREVA